MNYWKVALPLYRGEAGGRLNFVLPCPCDVVTLDWQQRQHSATFLNFVIVPLATAIYWSDTTPYIFKHGPRPFKIFTSRQKITNIQLSLAIILGHSYQET